MQMHLGSSLRFSLTAVALAGTSCSLGTPAPSNPALQPAAGAVVTEERPVTALPPYVLAKTGNATQGSGADDIRSSLAAAYSSTKGTTDGKKADTLPALPKVDSKLFGIALVTVDGAIYEVGSSRHEFPIESISKVYTLARAIELLGFEAVEKRIGVNATGQGFNSIIAIEMNKSNSPAMNPLVNPGALATVDALPAANSDAKWNGIISTYSAFAARPLELNHEVYKAESETNTRNRAIGTLLQAYEVVKGDVSHAVDLYARQCSVNVSARDLAVMGATLANGGKNPLTSQQVVEADTVQRVLAVMSTAGLYETTGQWMYEVGVPAKSGASGGIVAVVPGRFAIGTFAPPLDEAGNSVKGQRAIRKIIDDLDGSLFASSPVPRPNPSTNVGR